MELLPLVVYVASALLASTGVYGLASTRSLLRMLLSIEVFFNGVLLAFVAYLSSRPIIDTLASIVVVSVVAGEVIVLVALIVAFYHVARSLDSTPLEEDGV